MASKDSARTAGSGAPKKRRASTPKSSGRARVRKLSTPEVKLGHQAPNGISGGMYGLIERGAAKRPKIAKALRGCVEIRFKEDFAPMRVEFRPDGVVVEDLHEPSDNGDQPAKPDLVISGALPDVVQLASAPLVGGVPKLTDARGRAGLRALAGGRVKIEGSPLLARRLLKLLEI